MFVNWHEQKMTSIDTTTSENHVVDWKEEDGCQLTKKRLVLIDNIKILSIDIGGLMSIDKQTFGVNW